MLRMTNNVDDRFRIYCAGLFCFCSFILAYFSLYALYRVEEVVTYLPAMLIFSFGMVWIMLVRRLSLSFARVTDGYLFWEVFIAITAAFFIYSFVAYGFKLKHISRIYIFISTVMAFFSVLLWFAFLVWLQKKMKTDTLKIKNVLLVGNRFTTKDIIEMAKAQTFPGLGIVGIMPVDQDSFDGDQFMGYPVFQQKVYQDFESLLNQMVVDYVFLTVYRQDPNFSEKIILTCQSRGIEVWLKPDFMHRAVRVSKADHLGTLPVFVFSMGPEQSFRLIFKRIFDYVFGWGLFLLTLPLMLFIAWLIQRESPGPAVFVQTRVGINGRKFRFYKFRSMYQDAEQRREQLRQKNEMQGPVFKMENDPRVTPIGKFIRKYSLDELPQLWNVMKGDMSIVGPRPPIPTEVELYSGWHRRRLSMRPGLTCIWQVSGRNAITDFKDWVRLDLEYIDNWSLALDFKILLKTIPAVFKGTGV